MIEKAFPAQRVQCALSSSGDLPAGQAAHERAPQSTLNLPRAHAVQLFEGPSKPALHRQSLQERDDLPTAIHWQPHDRPSSIGRPDALHAVQFKSLQWSLEPRSLGYEIEVLAVATKPTVCLLNEFAVQATHADDPVLYLDV